MTKMMYSLSTGIPPMALLIGAELLANSRSISSVRLCLAMASLPISSVVSSDNCRDV